MAEIKKASAKSKAEAVLFSVGHKISIEDICRLCRSGKEDILAALQELKKEYDEKNSSLMLVEDGDFWKFSVRDHFIPMVRKIVTETELSRTVLETLAVIAFKYPVLQSELIKLRTNKAYDHLTELESLGYITRQKHSRTNLIKLTDKFFRYFNLTEEKLKEQFKDFDSIAKAIKEKEEEVYRIKEDQTKRAQELRQEDEKIRKEIESLDEKEEEFEIPIETYKPENIAHNAAKKEIDAMEISGLEIVQMPKERRQEENAEINAAEKTASPEKISMQEQNQILQNIQSPVKKQKAKNKGISLSPEMEKKANERAEEILRGENENKEENKQ